MSRRRPAGSGDHRTDSGFNLVELTMTIVIMGLMMTALGAAVTAVLGQQTSTEGRLDNVMAEQTLTQWLIPDLVSSETTEVGAALQACIVSCPANAELGGSNAVVLNWKSLTTVSGVSTEIMSRVSYRYVGVGGSFQVIRVQCTKAGALPETCSNHVIVRDAFPPTETFTPGVTSPDWMIKGIPAPVAGSSTDRNPTTVQVMLSGGGQLSGAGGGVEALSITSAGTVRRSVTPGSPRVNPALSKAISRCGGTFGIVVDVSGSIGSSAMERVKKALVDMMTTFRGTPVKIQIVTFSSTAAYTVGTYQWSWYADMSKDSEVDTLIAGLATLTSWGGTNWEDGLFRMFYDTNGTLQAKLPDTLLFFTDGWPTTIRWDVTAAAAQLEGPEPEQYLGRGNLVRAFGPAGDIISRFASTTTFIGVGIGPAIGSQVDWQDRSPTPPYAVTPANPPLQAKDIVAKAIALDAPVVLATQGDNGEYTNASTANVYISPDFGQFTNALSAVAFARCGGTVTLQTKVGTEPLPQPLTYTGNWDVNTKSVTTDAEMPSATMDFPVQSGRSFTVQIRPQIGTEHDGLEFESWSCRAGGSNVTPTLVDMGAWRGIDVTIKANQALSCIMTVRRP
ncbi:MAG: vWA domain-containing protein [Ilumatobacteraceae bacterium]